MFIFSRLYFSKVLELRPFNFKTIHRDNKPFTVQYFPYSLKTPPSLFLVVAILLFILNN